MKKYIGRKDWELGFIEVLKRDSKKTAFVSCMSERDRQTNAILKNKINKKMKEIYRLEVKE